MTSQAPSDVDSEGCRERSTVVAVPSVHCTSHEPSAAAAAAAVPPSAAAQNDDVVADSVEEEADTVDRTDDAALPSRQDPARQSTAPFEPPPPRTTPLPVSSALVPPNTADPQTKVVPVMGASAAPSRWGR